MALNRNLREDVQEIRDGATGLARSTYHLFHGMGSAYRHAVDRFKPGIDRVVDSTAYFLGTNAALSLGLWALDKGAEHAEMYRAAERFLDNHNVMEFFTKAAVYGAAYGIANWKHIIPKSWELAHRTTTPSWPNHAKTAGLLTGALLAYAHGALEPADTKLKTIDRYLGGDKTAQVIKNTAGTLQTIARTGHFIITNPGRTLDAIIESTEVPVDEGTSREIERSMEAAERREPGFRYTDNVSEAARSLQARGIDITPEKLVYLTRLVYFEGGFDRRAGNNAQRLSAGMRAITSVIKNRWEFDNAAEEQFGRRYFAGPRGDDLFDVAFRHTRKRTAMGRPYRVWQFTCVRDHPAYFHEHRGRRGWDMYAGGELQIAVGQMDRRRAALAYDAVMDVLTERINDPTRGALFYQNPEAVDRNNTPAKWRRRGLRELTRINSHTFWTYRDGNRSWQREMNVGELEQERRNMRYASYEPKKPAYRGV